jgi:predicted DCC family thiol-disulfide oxidoreductase YuxK
MIKVFYNGKCSLCSKEIMYYRRIATPSVFDWQDINLLNYDLKHTVIKTSDALKILNVIDSNNKLHLGVDAFIVIWNNLNYWRILARVLSIPIIKRISNIAYKLFKNWCFNKQSHYILKNSNGDKL